MKGVVEWYWRGARLLGEPWIKINPSSVSCRTIPLVLLLAQPADSGGLKYFPSPCGNYLTPRISAHVGTSKIFSAIESGRKRDGEERKRAEREREKEKSKSEIYIAMGGEKLPTRESKMNAHRKVDLGECLLS